MSTGPATVGGPERPNWWIVAPLVWAVPATVAVLQSLAPAVYSTRTIGARDGLLAAAQFSRYMLWAPFTPLLFAAARRFPFQRPGLARSIAVHACLALLCSALVETLSTQLQTQLISAVIGRPRVTAGRFMIFQTFGSWLVIGLLTYAAVVAVASALGYQRRLRAHLDVLREMKKEGRVRYIGVTDLLLPPSMPGPVAPNLVTLMRNEPLDFVGFDYSIGDRRAEETLLPVARERKMGVLGYFSFDRGRLFQRVGTRPLPEWAAEFDARTWGQFFLKYSISHPAVTVARAGTSNPAHMLENIGSGIGRLPDEAMRKRMAELVDSLPPAR